MILSKVSWLYITQWVENWNYYLQTNGRVLFNDKEYEINMPYCFSFNLFLYNFSFTFELDYSLFISDSPIRWNLTTTTNRYWRQLASGTLLELIKTFSPDQTMFIHTEQWKGYYIPSFCGTSFFNQNDRLKTTWEVRSPHG